MCEQLEWDDPRLGSTGDSRLVRQYRLQQSWYRQHVLRAEHGCVKQGDRLRPVGSLLAWHEVERRPALNFLEDPEVLVWVDQQVSAARKRRATLSEPRLRANMLSSMPMAFTLGAMLATAPDRSEIVRSAFGVELDEVTDVVPEWAPFPDHPLSDRTAFDLAIMFRRGRRTGVLGIETKYTEPLSPKPYDTERYRSVTAAATPEYFVPGAADPLVGSATNQLWRHRMLAAAIVESGDFNIAEVAAVGLAADSKLWSALTTVRRHCGDQHPFIGLSWESLIARLETSSNQDLARRFHARYLDLRHVENDSATAGSGRALGIDAAGKHGWVGVIIGPRGFEQAVVGSLEQIIAAAEPVDSVGIDIPIGSAPDGARLADTQAREFVGQRRASVFAAPSLDEIGETRAAHNATLVAAGRPKVSAQAWNLIPSMQEAAMVARSDPRVREVHPEVSFRALADEDLAWPKKSWNGQHHRRRLLAAAGIALPDQLPNLGNVAADDLLDAAAAAWSARRVASGQAKRIPSTDEFDEDRLVAIWY